MTRFPSYFPLLFLFFPASLLLCSDPSNALDYESDILPIFEAKCARCHLDGSSKGGVGLDLDRVGREIGDGKAIVPGDAEESELYEVVTLPNDDGDKMPPEGKGRPMTSNEIAKLKEWIEAGAPLGSDSPGMEEKESEDSEAGMAKRPDPIDGNWTNTSGRTIQATLVRVEGNIAVLRMNGKDFDYPISNLDAKAQAIVKEFAEAWEKAGL
ncbi:MAG: c-type cytochrome domain-containing protein [Verrucomicrobiota bacterium]